MEKKEFRSIHIDLKKREFRLNDIPMGSVSALELTFEMESGHCPSQKMSCMKGQRPLRLRYKFADKVG